MPPVFVIGAAIVSAAGAVASVAAAVVTTIASVVGPIVAAVGSVISAVVTTLGSVLSGIVNTIGSVVGGISETIQGAVNLVKTRIVEPFTGIIESLKTGIKGVADAITAPFKPILDPIKETLTTIKDFVVGTRTWIQDNLKPVRDLIELVEDISAMDVVKILLGGTEDIAGIIGDVEAGSGAATAQAITVLYRDIAQTTTETLEIVRNHYTRLRDTIDDTDERLRHDMDLAIAYAKETIQGEIDEVTNALSKRITPLEFRIAQIERRTMDLPFFQEMLIRALK